ncbi:MAG: hypothetical protein LRS49_01940, partial [Desulfurococcales archaeon]|nr:hypothetical protein [Desulfurococcales archaeon]
MDVVEAVVAVDAALSAWLAVVLVRLRRLRLRRVAEEALASALADAASAGGEAPGLAALVEERRAGLARWLPRGYLPLEEMLRLEARVL